MRILSARVLSARRDRGTDRVDALVRLSAALSDPAHAKDVRVRVSAPARAPGAAPLRARLLAAAKLTLARSGQRVRDRAEAA